MEKRIRQRIFKREFERAAGEAIPFIAIIALIILFYNFI